MSVFDLLLEEIEEQILSTAVKTSTNNSFSPEEEAVKFEQLMATVPHGDMGGLVPQYQKLRETMGREFLALGFLAGGYPPEVQPYLTGRDHRVTMAAALLTYPENLGPWWKTARLLGARQAVGMPVRNLLEVVQTSRQFSPRARRWVQNTAQRYIDALASEKQNWERQILTDGKSLKALIKYANLSVPQDLMEPLRNRRVWREWPMLSWARQYTVAMQEKGPVEAAKVLREAKANGVKLPLLYLEGATKNIYVPELIQEIIPLMTAKQLLQRLNTLNERGWLNENTETWANVAQVLDRAARDTRVAPADVRRARELVARLPKHVEQALERLENARREALPSSPGKSFEKQHLCLIVDKSGSMDEAITAASQLASYFADQGAKVTAITFDSRARVVSPEVGADGRPDWRTTFQYIRAGGNTSVGAGIEKAKEVANDADLWVLLTDGGDNTAPFATAKSPRPDHGRVVVLWFAGQYPTRELKEWISAINAETFTPKVRNGRLDFSALDDLVRLAQSSTAIQEWLASIPSQVFKAVVEGERIEKVRSSLRI